MSTPRPQISARLPRRIGLGPFCWAAFFATLFLMQAIIFKKSLDFVRLIEQMREPRGSMDGFFQDLLPKLQGRLWWHGVIAAAYLLLTVGGLRWIGSNWRRERRSALLAAGLCPSCGYDLRATPERCPECGTIPAR